MRHCPIATCANANSAYLCLLWLVYQLYVDELESKAEKKLAKEIDRSLNSSYRRFDNFIHNVKHG